MEMPSLSAKLSGPRILIKRDDLTGLAMGGQKCRLLQSVMADAKDNDADIILYRGLPEGNTGPQLAAAARKLGMEIIFLTSTDVDKIQGNRLILQLLGADIRTTGLSFEWGKVSAYMENLAAELRDKGRKPYIAVLNTPIAVAGYASVVPEICAQLREKGMTAQHLFLATTGMSFHASMILGARYYQAPFKVVGVMYRSVSEKEKVVSNISELINKTAGFFEMGFTIDSSEINLPYEYMGNIDEHVTQKSREAVKLVARTEGIFLDPLYTGRAMAALIDYIREDRIKREDTVILYHSGGIPAIFSHSEELIS